MATAEKRKIGKDRVIGKTENNPRTQRTFKGKVSPFSFFQTKFNYYILAAAVLTGFLGFILSGSGNWDSTESLFFAPILLVLAYAVLFPLAILYKKKETARVTIEKPENAL